MIRSKVISPSFNGATTMVSWNGELSLDLKALVARARVLQWGHDDGVRGMATIAGLRDLAAGRQSRFNGATTMVSWNG